MDSNLNKVKYIIQRRDCSGVEEETLMEFLPRDSRCSISILQKYLLKELECSNNSGRSCMRNVNNIPREIMIVVCALLLDVCAGPRWRN